MTSEQLDEPSATSADLSRRGVIRGVAVAGLAAPLLVACGGSGQAAGSGTGTKAPAKPGKPLTGTADVPSGGGIVLPDQKVVVTQPTDGEFKAFTAVCTHQGCLVASVTDGAIVCNCHGSLFSIEDGSVEQGPATQPLAAIPIDVQGNKITLA